MDLHRVKVAKTGAWRYCGLNWTNEVRRGLLSFLPISSLHTDEVATVHINLGLVPIPTVLEVLRSRNIHSLMVEGGQKVISSFLTACPAVVDSVIITIAPIIVGDNGVGVVSDLESEVRAPFSHRRVDFRLNLSYDNRCNVLSTWRL